MLQKRTDILSDDEIQKAVDWLRDNADESAKCRAERIYIEEYRKSLKALLMKKFVELPISAQEREAYAHADYINHIKALKIAVEKDEKMKFLRASAEAKIEAWRTQQANLRSIKL
jgi:cell division GTPase FtsZ